MITCTSPPSGGGMLSMAAALIPGRAALNGEKKLALLQITLDSILLSSKLLAEWVLKSNIYSNQILKELLNKGIFHLQQYGDTGYLLLWLYFIVQLLEEFLKEL